MRRAALVGRRAELRSIAAALAGARSGLGGGVFLTGEPGIGKTRLAAEAIGVAVDTGMVTAKGRVSTVGPIVPYRPLIEALLSLGRSGLLPELDTLGGYGPVLAHLLHEQRPAAGITASPIMVAEAVLRLLAAVGRGRGCLLVFDDLHDADAETLAVVEYLLDNLGHQPTTLLLTARREPCMANDLATRARQQGLGVILELQPLDIDEVHALVAAQLGVDPGDISAELLDRLMADSAGVPFVVEELVYDMTRHGLDDARDLSVPVTVARSINRRTDRLGPRARTVLSIAALFGQRFPLPVLRQAVGCDERDLVAILHAGASAHLIQPDEASPDWYAFRHRLAAETLLDDLGPGERADYAQRAVDALTGLYTGLPGEWCARAAELSVLAGDAQRAVGLYREAGRRAMAEGAVASAVTLLTRAHHLVGPATPAEARAEVMELLLHAVGESARFDHVPDLAIGLDALSDHDVPGPRRAGLYAQLANVANMAGQPADALRHLEVARKLLGDSAMDAHTAPVDVVAAHVELSRLANNRLHTATELAGRAAAAAQRAGLPGVACDALLLLGYLARERDEPAAVAHFERARAIADEHRLPVFRVYAEVFLARIASLRDGRMTDVEIAIQEALRIGVLALAYETTCALALADIQQCEFEAAESRIREGLADASRLRLGRAVSMLRMAEAVLYAHQGRRTEMSMALDQLAPLIDNAPGVRPASYGLARAICSLLEEDQRSADQEFAQALAYDAENPAAGEFGKHGIVLLLGVLAGRVGWQHYAAITQLSASGTRWNRQFVQMAHAVLLGRDGRTGEATAVAAAALEAAEIYPMARNLCLRLIGRAAYDDGWGDPVQWLRQAEEYFHCAGIPVVAGACRALLRGMGAPVRQRRAGVDQVPPGLRRMGVTFREFEVAKLVAERFGNKDIALRLHISPRTVEKHVASLLQKTGCHDRAAFTEAARDLFAM